MKRRSEVCLLRSSAPSRLSTDLSPIRSRPSHCSRVSPYRSAGVFKSPRSTSCEQVWSPSPSMSIAPREAKWRSRPWSCAGQDRFVQRVMAPSRCTSAPQAGQWVGMRNSGRPSGGRSSAMTRTISGITSPARRRKIRSPLRTSLRRTSSSLCRVARATVTPPTCTGVRKATGVSAPVRPTLTWMSSTVVASSSVGNLYATAQRGVRDTAPSRRR